MSLLIYRTPSRQYTKFIANNIALWQEEAMLAHRKNYLHGEHQNVYKAVETGLQVEETVPAATELLLELSPFIEKYGHWREWIPLLKRAVDAHTETSKQWVLQTELAFLYQMNGESETAVSLLQETLTNLNKQTDKAQWGHVHYHLGNSYITLEQYENARKHILEALTIFEQHPDNTRGGTAPAKNLLGLINLHTGNHAEAGSFFIEARQQWEQAGERDYAFTALLNEALVHEMGSNYEAAIRCYQQAKLFVKTGGSLLDKARMYLNLGSFYANQGDVKEAESAYLCVDKDTLYQHGHITLYTQLVTSLGYVAVEQGALETAVSYSQEAITLWQQLGEKFMQANAIENLGDAYAHSGNTSLARDTYQDGLILTNHCSNNPLAHQLHQTLCEKIENLPNKNRGMDS